MSQNRALNSFLPIYFVVLGIFPLSYIPSSQDDRPAPLEPLACFLGKLLSLGICYSHRKLTYTVAGNHTPTACIETGDLWISAPLSQALLSQSDPSLTYCQSQFSTISGFSLILSMSAQLLQPVEDGVFLLLDLLLPVQQARWPCWCTYFCVSPRGMNH